jgi:excisionase family DNA binding protein
VEQATKTKAFYSIAELSVRWGVGRTTIYREVERGRLKKTRIGGQVRFSAESVETYERAATQS